MPAGINLGLGRKPKTKKAKGKSTNSLPVDDPFVVDDPFESVDPFEQPVSIAQTAPFQQPAVQSIQQDITQVNQVAQPIAAISQMVVAQSISVDGNRWGNPPPPPSMGV